MSAPAGSGLPPAWLTPGPMEVTPAALGETEAEVFRLSAPGGATWYVKRARGSDAPAARTEFEKLVWLNGRSAPVARAVDCVEERGSVLFRTAAVPGEPALTSALPPHVVVRHVALALRTLHETPSTGWPFGSADAARLAAAARNLETDRRYRGARARRAGAAALAQLRERGSGTRDRPVLVHGDADLANVLVSPAGGAFVDCGDVGLADRTLDLYVAADSIAARFGEAAVRVFYAAYGASPDQKAFAYYEALDAFF